MKARQLKLFNEGKKLNLEHGGELAIGKRKGPRPLLTKKPIHLVLRSHSATGPMSLLLHSRFIRTLIASLCNRFAIVLYEFSINSTHVHLLIRIRDREGFKNFLRVFCGNSAMVITGARRGQSLKEKFWDVLPYTRLAEWGRAFEIVKRYVIQNRLESLGLIAFQLRSNRKRSVLKE